MWAYIIIVSTSLAIRGSKAYKICTWNLFIGLESTVKFPIPLIVLVRSICLAGPNFIQVCFTTRLFTIKTLLRLLLLRTNVPNVNVRSKGLRGLLTPPVHHLDMRSHRYNIVRLLNDAPSSWCWLSFVRRVRGSIFLSYN